MSNNNNNPLGKAPWFDVIISTGFGSGFIPVAPGTAAGFVGLLFWYAIDLPASNYSYNCHSFCHHYNNHRWCMDI